MSAEVPKPAAPRRDIYREALQVQDASNLSGVVKSLATAMDCIWAEARDVGEGTEYVNTHPVVRLFVSKLMSLAHYTDDQDEYSLAAATCRLRVRKEPPTQ
jgi:hypothetical protein